jgi:hypothetical protein
VKGSSTKEETHLNPIEQMDCIRDLESCKSFLSRKELRMAASVTVRLLKIPGFWDAEKLFTAHELTRDIKTLLEAYKPSATKTKILKKIQPLIDMTQRKWNGR